MALGHSSQEKREPKGDWDSGKLSLEKTLIVNCIVASYQVQDGCAEVQAAMEQLQSPVVLLG